MSHQIVYEGINRKVESNGASSSLLDVSIQHKIPHLHECGGRGRCTTCRVRVLDGIQNLSPRTQLERTSSHARKWDSSIRLACQAYAKGDVKLLRLIWSSAQVNLQL